MENPKMVDIMVVDDVLADLHFLTTLLREQGYKVRSIPSGKLALSAAEKEPPDLILLDICMPEIDGYKVCTKFKNNKNLQDIPILFISALSDTIDKVKAFNIGGEDYITKPFQFEEVNARVRTHLALRNARLELQALLSRTLTGSICIMTEILSLIHPQAFENSNRYSQYVQKILKYMNVPESYSIDIAAKLSTIGCIAVPPDILNKKYSGQILTVREQEMFNSYPKIGGNLLENIPNFEIVVEIIKNQLGLVKESDESNQHKSDVIKLGSEMLKLVIDYDQMVMSGSNPIIAIEKLQKNECNYAIKIFDVLKKVIESEAANSSKSLKIEDLQEGMIIMDDIVTETGLKLISRKTQISINLLNLLHQFTKQYKIKEPISVIE